MRMMKNNNNETVTVIGIDHGSFHGTESETDITIMIYRKLQVTLIYIRSQCLDTHCLTFVHQLRALERCRLLEYARRGILQNTGTGFVPLYIESFLQFDCR